MHLRSGFENRRARVEMIPLMDLVFLLLVSFVYATMSMVIHRGIKVRLPAAATAERRRDQPVAVTVTARNDILVEGQPVALADVAARVRERRGPPPGRPVFIEGDRESDLGVSIGVLDRLKAAGIVEVTFSCAEAPGAETP
jgi:biopolymer transport protein ExbD